VIWRLCHVGDETRLSLLGKATFLETYAGSTQAADLLDFVEEEHSAERYRSWLESDFAKIWVAMRAKSESLNFFLKSKRLIKLPQIFYDALKRLTKISYSDGTTPTVQYAYDGNTLTGCTTTPRSVKNLRHKGDVTRHSVSD